MIDDKDQEEIIDVQEVANGGAVVELPDSIPSPQGDGSDEADEAAAKAEILETGSVDPDAEALREAKRDKRRARKEYHKKVNVEKDNKLTYLERQNQELLERLAVVEKKTHGTEIARLNKAIEDQESKILFAKQKIKEATETGNGDLLTSAQEMWFEARRQFEALDNLKKQSVAPQQNTTIQAADPYVKRYAGEWMANNPWYDPNSKDPDSKRALNEDQILADEGYDPRTREYWEELDYRLQKMLPHRYNTEVESVSPSTKRPRNVVTSSGRESMASSGGGKNTFTLSPDQVRAMKDAGMWDDPDKRAKMIRRYAQDFRNNKL
jgi:hypothetical protein